MYESLMVQWRHSKCIITSRFLIRHAFSILSSADTLIGTSDNNRMNGQGGNDAMNGRSGNDQICLLLG